MPSKPIPQACTPSGTRIPPTRHAAIEPTLLAYYAQRRHGNIPEKPYEEWGSPESKMRKRYLEIIDEREIDDEEVQFKTLDWNQAQLSPANVEGEPLSPKGGPKVSSEDVPAWVGKADGPKAEGGGAMGRIAKGVKHGIGRRRVLKRRLLELGWVPGRDGKWVKPEGGERKEREREKDIVDGVEITDLINGNVDEGESENRKLKGNPEGAE